MYPQNKTSYDQNGNIKSHRFGQKRKGPEIITREHVKERQSAQEHQTQPAKDAPFKVEIPVQKPHALTRVVKVP